MIDDTSRERRLADDGLPRAEELDAWTVPEADADLTDRIMDALEADMDRRSQAADLATEQEKISMHATITESPSRGTIVPIIIGIATAAAILAAFWVGRSSVSTAEPIERVVRDTAVVAPAPRAPAPVVAEPAPTVPAQVRVRFAVQPSDASIFVYDGTREQSVEPGQTIALARLGGTDGDYMVTMQTPDGSISRVSLRLGTTREQTFVADLRPTAAVQVRNEPDDPPRAVRRDAPRTSQDLKDPFGKTGILRIGTSPGAPPADVHVDGIRAGKTPIPSYLVAPGRHVIRFRWPGGKEIRKTVTVEAGRANVVKAG